MKRNLLIFACFVLIVTSLVAKTDVRMGVFLDELRSQKFSNLKETHGVLVKKVSDSSPAEKAGLREKDIILELDGDKVYTVDQVKKMLSNYKPMQKIKIKYIRNGDIENTRIKLAEKKSPEINKRAYLGVYLEEIDDNIRKQLEFDENYGILLDDIVKDSPADKAGLKEEDILLKFNSEKVYTVDQLINMLNNFEPEQKIKLQIFRNNKTHKISLILGEQEDLKSFYHKEMELFEDFDVPEKVLFYKYAHPTSDKWIGIKLKIKEEKIEKNGDSKLLRSRIIEEVMPEAPAAKAGLKKDDEIVAVDGKSDLQIREIVMEKEIGEEIELTLLRDGDKIVKKVQIEKRKNSFAEDMDVKVSIDDGEIKILVDGIEKSIADLEEIGENLEDLKVIKQLNLHERPDVKRKIRELKSLKKIKVLKDIDQEI